MARIIFCMPPLENCFIIFWVCSNWLRRRLTSCTVTPAPVAMRRLREALISSGLVRSSGVMALMMPSMRRIAFSSTPPCNWPAAWANWAGSLSSMLLRPPILRIWPIWSLKSLRSKPLPLLSFWANCLAFSSSTPRRASSTRDRMSPMPRMRLAIRSGWNSSRPASFSPTPANLRGFPVTCRTDSAAPPRESPSSLVSTTPVRGSASLKARAVLTAS